jgi:hypothetical protein
MVLWSATTAKHLATSGQTASNLPTCRRSVWRRGTPKLACCNCKFMEGEKGHPFNYRGCKHATEQIRKRKSHRTSKTTTGRVSSSNNISPGLSFTALLRSNTNQQQWPHLCQVAVAGPATMDLSIPTPLQQHQQ